MTEASYAIWLYGSHARGDADACSDVDVLTISDNIVSTDQVEGLTGLTCETLSVSQYSWAEIQGISDYGSLFLHHIRLEGYPLYETPCCHGKLRLLLNRLVSYQRARYDLAAFCTTLSDVRESISNDGSALYELSVLATLLRHASILGCYISGKPCFGRKRPVDEIVRLWVLDASVAHEFKELYSFRLYSVGRGQFPGEANKKDVEMWCDRISLILHNLEARIDAYEQKNSRTGSKN